jgi:hypothetical protein
MFSTIVRWGLSSAFCLALAAGGADTARAGITFTPGNNPQPGQENILLNTGTSGSTVFGETNQTHTSVSFSSTTDSLLLPSMGQARVSAVDGLVNNLTISVPGGYYTGLIINPFKPGGSGTNTAYLTAIVNKVGGGTYTANYHYDLGNGENYVTIVADGGESIQSLTIDDAKGFQDLRQPRISGLGENAVPEPASIVMGAMALGGIGLARLRGRSRTA